MKKVTPIRYLNSQDQEFRKDMKGKVCGIMCVAMILTTYRKDFGTIQDLIDEGRNLDAYIPGIGWDHRGLVRVLDEYKIKARRFDMKKRRLLRREPILEVGFENKIKNYIDERKVLIVSVDKGFSSNPSSTHLIAVHGYGCDQNNEVTSWIISDPSSLLSRREEISLGHFKKYFRGLGIVCFGEK